MTSAGAFSEVASSITTYVLTSVCNEDTAYAVQLPDQTMPPPTLSGSRSLLRSVSAT
jgi:hypothetical protein